MASGPTSVVLSDQQHVAWRILGPQASVSVSTGLTFKFKAKSAFN